MKKDVVLHLDTSSRDTIRVELRVGEVIYASVSNSKKMKAQMTLPMIAQLLRHHHFKPYDVSYLTVNPGPGSFTGLRVGVTIANAFGWVCGIEVNGKKGLKDIVKPVYEKSVFDSTTTP